MNGATTTTTAVPGGRRRRVRKQSSIEKADAADVQAKCIKYSALFLLVAQMVGLVLLMRYSRTHHPPDVPLYLSSTAVFVMEVMKLIICILVVAYQTRSSFLYELKFHTIHSPMEILKLCVPSLLYTIQNNLLYLALTNLDAATYQVCYQLKILTTALFSAILLHRKFSTTKWASLVVLTVGVAIVQLSGSKDQHQEDSDNTSSSDRYRTIGLIAVFCAAATSGFSGVYFGT
jgi:UDP-sugar transporter A1/2/3